MYRNNVLKGLFQDREAKKTKREVLNRDIILAVE